MSFAVAARRARIAPAFARLLLLAFIAAPAFADEEAPAAAAQEQAIAIALDPGLGPLHHPVSTRNAQAQAYFDQGLKLVFAFNHPAAIRSFQRAAELDPNLAM